MAAFLGIIFVYESCFLAQWLVSHRTRQQGGVVTPPKSFAYQASLPHSLLVAQKENQKAELAPHLPPLCFPKNMIMHLPPEPAVFR